MRSYEVNARASLGNPTTSHQNQPKDEQGKIFATLEHQHIQIKKQFRDSKLRQQNAVRRLHKIQKDLKNVEQDNLQLQQLLTLHLQRKLNEH